MRPGEIGFYEPSPARLEYELSKIPPWPSNLLVQHHFDDGIVVYPNIEPPDNTQIAPRVEDYIGGNSRFEGQVYPNNNPKAAVGESKCPLHLVPPALSIGVAEAMKNGADKYGAYNFRDSKIAASVYMGAILRHLYAWWDGEDNAQDSGIHHLKHLGASVGLMLDAMAKGTFDDDRPTSGGAAELLREYQK